VHRNGDLLNTTKLHLQRFPTKKQLALLALQLIPWRDTIENYLQLYGSNCGNDDGVFFIQSKVSK
jgi:hypothetical protein